MQLLACYLFNVRTPIWPKKAPKKSLFLIFVEDCTNLQPPQVALFDCEFA